MTHVTKIITKMIKCVQCHSHFLAQPRTIDLSFLNRWLFMFFYQFCTNLPSLGYLVIFKSISWSSSHLNPSTLISSDWKELLLDFMSSSIKHGLRCLMLNTRWNLYALSMIYWKISQCLNFFVLQLIVLINRKVIIGA